MIRPVELIQRKRDGGELTGQELDELMLGYARDEIPDYQLSAFCMALSAFPNAKMCIPESVSAYMRSTES